MGSTRARYNSKPNWQNFIGKRVRQVKLSFLQITATAPACSCGQQRYVSWKGSSLGPYHTTTLPLHTRFEETYSCRVSEIIGFSGDDNNWHPLQLCGTPTRWLQLKCECLLGVEKEKRKCAHSKCRRTLFPFLLGFNNSKIPCVCVVHSAGPSGLLR